MKVVLIQSRCLGYASPPISPASEERPLSPDLSRRVSLPGQAGKDSSSQLSAALNWPNHRGTATAFPLSAFGLGALFFTAISFIAFPENTSNYLILSSAGTIGLCYCSVFFLRVVSHSSPYSALPTGERRESNPLNRSKSRDSPHNAGRHSGESGMVSGSSSHQHGAKADPKDSDETSSLISKSSSSSPGDVPSPRKNTEADSDRDSHHLDIRTIGMLRHVEFYQIWLLLGLLTGIGLMTIK